MVLASKFMEVGGFMRVEFVYILRLGSFQDGFKCGIGKLTYPDGSIYEGKFENDFMNGNGTLIM